MVNCLIWNVRGLNDDIRQFNVKALMKKHKVSVAALLETKIKYGKSSRVLASLGSWCLLENYDFAHNGRIWVIWDKSKVTVNRISLSDQY